MQNRGMTLIKGTISNWMKGIAVLNCSVKMYSVLSLYLLCVQIIVVICVKSSKLIKHLLDLI